MIIELKKVRFLQMISFLTKKKEKKYNLDARRMQQWKALQ